MPNLQNKMAFGWNILSVLAYKLLLGCFEAVYLPC